MQQLKKIGAIGGAISLVLCWPLAVGQIGQNVIRDGVEHLNTPAVMAEVVSYDRGYLSSEVQTRYVVTDPDLAYQLELDGLPSEYIVNSHVTHGLFNVSATSVLENVSDFPLQLDTVTQLNGNTNYTLTLDTWNTAINGSDGAMVSVSASELKGYVTVLGEMTYELTMPSVEVDFVSGEKLLVSGVTGSGDGRMQNGFWLGEQEMSIADTSVVETSQQPILTMKNARYAFSSALEEVSKRVNSQHVVTIDNVVMPQGEADNLTVDFELGDLDADSFEYLVNMYQDNPQLTQADIESALPYIDTLFSKGFYLAMNKMSLTFGGKGEFESKWKLQIPEGTDNITQSPDSIMTVMTGNLETFFSDGLVELYPFIEQEVDSAMDAGFVQKIEKGYEVKAELKDGSLVFPNGQQIPLLALLLPAMMHQ